MSDSPAVPTLEYRGPEGKGELPAVWRSRWCRIALACWAIPLIMGLVDFLAWACFRFRSTYLVGTGLLAIAVGMVAALIGGISVLVLFATRWPRSSRPFRQAVGPSLVLLALLGSNFPVAWLVIQAVIWIDPAQFPHHGPPYAH